MFLSELHQLLDPIGGFVKIEGQPYSLFVLASRPDRASQKMVQAGKACGVLRGLPA